MRAEPQTHFAAVLKVLGIKEALFLVSFRVAFEDFVHRLMGHTAYFIHQWMVKPNVARGDAISRRGAVEHEAAQAVHRLPCVGPAAVAHQILREVPVVATQAPKTLRVREIS